MVKLSDFEKDGSEVVEIRDHESDFTISHYDSKLLVIVLREYKKMMKRRIGTNEMFDFEERLEDVQYLLDLFKYATREAVVNDE